MILRIEATSYLFFHPQAEVKTSVRWSFIHVSAISTRRHIFLCVRSLENRPTRRGTILSRTAIDC
jgi:hypothetical protein